MKSFYTFIWALFFCGISYSQVKIGSTTYSTLSAALTSINNNQHSGHIVVEITGDITENQSATLTADNDFSYQSVKIRPAANVTSATITFTAGSLNLDSREATIDGQNKLTIRSTANTVSVVTFSGKIDNCGIRNCKIFGGGGNAAVSLGVYTSTGASNCFVENCEIGPYLTNVPKWGIFASGDSNGANPALLNGVSIKDNIIHDFDNATQSIGILVQNVSGFAIENNRIYQSMTRTTAKWNGIVGQSLFNNNNRIKNNVIGYANASGTGTLSLVNAGFVGISVSANGLFPNSTPVVAIENNTINNISISGNVGNFHGIFSDRMETTHAFNIIGGSGPTAISLVSGSGNTFDICGIFQVGKGQMTVTDNSVSGVYAAGAGNIKFYGISMNNSGTGTATDGMLCERNTIGDAAGNNGININADGPQTTLIGIYNRGRKGHVRANILSKLTCKSSGTGLESGYGTYGMIYDAPENVGEFKIEMNKVSNIGNLHQTAASVVCGILHTWRTSNTIAFNTVLGLKSATSNSNGVVYGIAAHSAQKGIKLYNNAVGITLSNGSHAQLTGISCNTSGETNNSTQIGHNSVYLGGEKSGGTSRSVCLLFQNQSLQATHIFDNILENQRHNHYAATGDIMSISCTTGTGFNMVPTFTNNVFFGLGTGYILGYTSSSGGYKYTPAEWGAWGQFSNSGYFGNPRFVYPNAEIPDLHIADNTPTVVEGRGAGGQGFDFDIQPRGDYTPNDIGADAGNFVPLAAPVITAVSGTSLCTGDYLMLSGNLIDINEVKIGNVVITPRYFSGSSSGFQPLYVPIGSVNVSGLVTVTNSAGSFTFNTVVTTSAVPVISQQPQPAQVCQGQLAVFDVVASNAASYQWRRNGIPLENAGNYSGANTATLSVVNVSGALSGQFDVVVSGTSANCQTISNSVALSVALPDIALVPSAPTTLCAGESVTLTPMLHTPALQFDGVDDYIDVRGFNYGSLTMSFWIKTTQTGATGAQWFDGTGIVDGRPQNGDMNGKMGTALMGDKLAFGVGVNSITNATLVSSTSVNTGQWVHVAVSRTYATGELRIFINGQSDAFMNWEYGEFLTTLTALRLGGNLSGSQYFNGSIDDVKLYPRVLTNAEILLLSQGGSVSNLLDFHLALNENSGSEVRNALNESYTVNGAQWVDRLSPAVFQNPTWSNGATTQTVTVNQSGTYGFSGVGGACQSFGTASIAVQVSQPLLSVNSPNNLFFYCGSAPVMIQASGAATYSWSPATGLNTMQGASVLASPAQDTLYTLTGTDQNGCQSTLNVWVFVAPPAPLTITASATYILPGQMVTLETSGSNAPLIWFPAVTSDPYFGHSVTVAPTQTTTYTVSGMYCEIPQSITIYVLPEPSATDNALHFDGVDDYVQMPAQTDGISGSFTVAVWVKPAHPTKTMHVFSTRNGANANTFDIQITNGNLIHGDIGNGTDWLTTSADAVFAYQPNQWMHIAYKVTPGQYKIFVNGNLIQSGVYQGTAVLYNNTNFITIGKNPGENTLFNGTMDDLQISSFEIPDEMMVHAPRHGLPAQIRYNFDEGIAGGNNPTVTFLNNQNIQSTLHGTLYNFTLNGPASNWVTGQSAQSQAISMIDQNAIVYTSIYNPGATTNSGLPVTYISTDPAIASVSGNSILIHNGGTVTIIAQQNGNAFYEQAEPKFQQLTITPKTLTIVNASAQNKVYDRTTLAVLNGTLSGIVGTDAVSFTPSASFASFNAGNGIAVTASAVLTGPDAAKYSITQPTGLFANITPKSLTVTGAVAANKVYDGTTAALINGVALNGIISPDVVTIASNAGTFASPNVGNSILVTAQLTLGGAAASNYSIVQPTGLSANITPVMLTATLSGTSSICSGQQGSLQVAINSGGVFTVLYTDGTLIYTANNYSAGQHIAVAPANTSTYTLVAVTAANAQVSVSGSATITVLPQTIYYADADADGYGNAAISLTACTQPAGYVLDNTDCNDNNNAMHQTFAFFTDADADGYGTGMPVELCAVDAATPPIGYAVNNTDCNDNDNLMHQTFAFYVDADGDGFGTADLVNVCAVNADTPPHGFAINNTDCNDADASVYKTIVLFVDADNDGYTSGVTQLVCSGASTPLGFVAFLTAIDCNDTIAAIHPNAAEIPYNGVDDNCNGIIDENGTITTTLLPTSCGSTLTSIGSIIGITTVVGHPITGYRIRVTSGSEVQQIERNVPNFTMTQFASYHYATTYTVEIQLQRAGVWLDSWGAPCLISTPAILEQGGSGSVNPSQCGITLAQINTLISTTSLPGVTGYRFRITDLTTPTGPNVVQTIDRTQNWFSLPMLARFNYGTLYRVEVAVKTTGGYGGFGSPCELNSPAVPSLVNCGGSVLLKTTAVSTNSVAGVSQYRFQIVRASDNATSTVDRGVNWFNFNMVPASAYTMGGLYYVRVAVMTAGSWSPYGDACEITAPGGTGKGVATDEHPSQLQSEMFKAIAYPSPFTAEFSIGIESASTEKLQVNVYDMLGRLIETVDTDVSEINHVAMGAKYPSGVYNIIVRQGDEVKTLRVIKR